MTVYVDNMRAIYGRMIMCHMVADTDDELHNMADIIGLPRKYWQAPPSHRSHYDISLAKRELAIQAGAKTIDQRQLAAMTRRKKETGAMGTPEDAIAWILQWYKDRRQEA